MWLKTTHIYKIYERNKASKKIKRLACEMKCNASAEINRIKCLLITRELSKRTREYSLAENVCTM